MILKGKAIVKRLFYCSSLFLIGRIEVGAMKALLNSPEMYAATYFIRKSLRGSVRGSNGFLSLSDAF
jgi:hypothetical protein